MKIRVIIWIVVAIVVVAGAFFLILTGKSRRTKVTIEDLKFQIQRDEETINELAAKLAQARAVPLPPANTQILNEAEARLNEARAQLEKAKQSDNIRTIEENLKQAHSFMTKCRRLLRAATKPRPGG
jgi:flagellar basal body-associated protein FliL